MTIAILATATGPLLTGCGGSSASSGISTLNQSASTRSANTNANTNANNTNSSNANSGSSGNSNNNGNSGNASSSAAYVLIQTSSPAAAAAVANSNSSTIVDSDPDSGIYELSVPAGQNASNFAQRLANDPRLTDAEPDVPVGLAETDGQSIHLAFDRSTTPVLTYDSVAASSSINQTAYQQVDLGNAQNTARGAGVIVAVIDTGVMTTHPNLISHLLPGYNEVVRGTPPEDIADGTTNAAWGHGTMVTGVITRLAPDAKILPVRVLNGDGTGRLLDAIKGIEYSVKQGARVINLSMDTPQYSPVLNNAIQKAISAGVVVVAAAGNQGISTPRYPASLSGVIGVASTEPDDTLSSFSNFATNAALAAPGVSIRSTYVNGGFASWSGTSFAAPFVTAAAAMTLSVKPSLGSQDVSNLLTSTGRSLDAQNPAYIGQIGHGELDIAQAIAAAANH